MRAVNEGAYYYLQKPFANEELLAICRRAAETRQLRVENKRLKKEIRTGKGRPAGRPIGVAPNFVAALKLAETVRGPKRRLFWGMLLAILCSLAGATWIILTLCYEHGGINLHPFFMTHQAVRTFTDMGRPLLNPTMPDVRGWIFTGIGGIIQIALMVGQHRFYWWPLHPLGFPISVGWLTAQIWFSVFISWLLKLFILKYGGIKLFSAARPFFLGLILGEATAGGFWLIVDWIMGESGNLITVM